MSAPAWQRVADIAFGTGVAALAMAAGWRSLKKSAEPLALALKWLLSAALVAGTIMLLRRFPSAWWPALVVVPAMTLGVLWAPSAGAIMARLLTGGVDGGNAEIEPQAFYSIAEAKRRKGRPQEAIQAVREQLEKFPGDFPGVMLLASIQAEDLNDLPGAQTTLERWIQSPAATPHGIASALTALADWQLKFAQDPEAARAALDRIVKSFPDTPIAHRAAQRLAHLPTLDHLLGSKAAPTLALRPGEKDIGLRKDFIPPGPRTADPDALAASCVEQLRKHPADTDAREKLAVLYAEHFHRLDLADEQLEQLIGFPNESPKHVVRWLNLMADLHIRFGGDAAAAEAALRRVLERFPNTAHVEPTLARLASLGGELKAHRQPRLKTLGRYEKDIGLKQTKTG
jgi:tetratricopeptide (TPR) repeat protein